MSSAFDTLPHTILIERLGNIGTCNIALDYHRTDNNDRTYKT